MLKKEFMDSLWAVMALVVFIIMAIYLLIQDVSLVGPI
jgi:hypothetical protein